MAIPAKLITHLANLQRHLLESIDVPVETHTLRAGNLTTFYLEAGATNSDAAPIILLHGASASGFCWYNVIGALVAAGRRVIVPDIIGHGQSEKPLSFYTRAYYTTWLNNFREGLSVPTVDLVGNSLGGEIAAQFTLNYPQHVRKLVLSNATGLGNMLTPQTIFYALGRTWTFLLPKSRFPSRQFNADLHKKLHQYLVYDLEKFDRARQLLAEYEIESLRLPGGKRAAWLGAIGLALPISAQKLSQISQPTLLLWGEEDRLVPLKYARAAKKHIINARVQVIPQASHLAFFDQPQMFNQALTQFLNS